MAQPVYNEHPLEAYLRRQRLPSPTLATRAHTRSSLTESGEGVELMPGGASEFVPEDLEDDEDDLPPLDLDWLPPTLRQIFEASNPLCS